MTFELAIAHSVISLDDINLDVNRHTCICEVHFYVASASLAPIMPCYASAVRLCHITMAIVNQTTITLNTCIYMTKIDRSIVISSEFRD